MRVEQYIIKNNLDMDSMHDSYSNEIRIENNCLIVVYDRLDEGVLDSDGNPYYKNKRLTIKYEFETFCAATIHYGKNKCLYIDMVEEIDKFNKVTHKCFFESYKYSVDSFSGLTLHFSLSKLIDGKYHEHKYWGLDIELDATNVTYIWE